MNPITHYLAGWATANAIPLSRKERAIVAIAGIIPDVDGLGMIQDWLTRNSAQPTNFWGAYHHVLAHNIGFGLLVTATSMVLATQRRATGALVFVSFHLHLLGDLLGARGQDGDQWPIPYLSPFSQAWKLTWGGQWELNAWPNFAITFVLLFLMFYWARTKGRADQRIVAALRQRFGTPT
jgi:inner membrane protein